MLFALYLKYDRATLTTTDTDRSKRCRAVDQLIRVLSALQGDAQLVPDEIETLRMLSGEPCQLLNFMYIWISCA